MAKNKDSSGPSNKKRKKTENSESFLTMFEMNPLLARMKASISENSLHDIEVEPSLKAGMLALDAMKEERTDRNSSKSDDAKHHATSNEEEKEEIRSPEVDEYVDDIWQQLSNSKIDLQYACVGYTFGTHRAILDNDLLVTLLITYGYPINAVVAFIDDFLEASKEAEDAPILMTNSHVDRIYSDVKTLPHLDPDSKSKKKKPTKKKDGKNKKTK